VRLSAEQALQKRPPECAFNGQLLLQRRACRINRWSFSFFEEILFREDFFKKFQRARIVRLPEPKKSPAFRTSAFLLFLRYLN